MTILEYLTAGLAGGLCYCGIELLWQGGTHWTMLILGGLCFLMMYSVNLRLQLPLLGKWLLCAATVTAMEFVAGCLLNLWLGWEVWSYRGLPGNLLGQICPRYAFYWLLLSVPGSGLSVLLHRCFHGATGESRTTVPSGTELFRTFRERK